MTALALAEALLARALVSADPLRALRKAAADRRLPADLRKRLSAVDPDGFCLSALLVVRLRFERLLRGSAEAEAWFEREPAGFTRAFRAYHLAVPPRDFLPAREARSFSRWLQLRGSMS